IRREWVEKLHPIGVGVFSVVRPLEFSTIDFTLKPHAGRWEGGAMNIPGITALGASLELLLTVGIETIERRVLELTNYLCDAARSRGWTIFSSREHADKSGIVSLIHSALPASEVLKRCRAAGVIVNNRADRVRVSPHAYNTEDEINRFFDAAR
ncbi:MAG TPA: aminotransferase class V-fold PLP-dependent enzyme, partial [Gemmata sp.]|nr:aminotransferase class V-fold PLP-dependent enzyme [Gemmata sp.]